MKFHKVTSNFNINALPKNKNSINEMTKSTKC